jgi:hypothetical protein
VKQKKPVSSEAIAYPKLHAFPKGRMMADCPICHSTVLEHELRPEHPQVLRVGCPRCGDYILCGTAISVVSNEGDGARHRRAITSHAIRRMQRSGGERPVIFEDDLRAIWRSDRLPAPQQQCDILILLLGESQVSWSEAAFFQPERIDGEIGAALRRDLSQPPGWRFIVAELAGQSLVDWREHAQDGHSYIQLSLSVSGWRRYEELKHRATDSRTAFMAMKFGRSRSDAMFRDHFIPAVRATGFELRRLDMRPKAGLIDARMEVDIRTARFLVADLTHGNRGAYWEAGFAHGLDKPVFYTCEEGYFRRFSTHFDTNHHHTVMWNAAAPDRAVEDLKAVIRATLRAEAKLRDDDWIPSSSPT